MPTETLPTSPVVIVDDDEDVRRLLTALFEDAGYATAEAATGEDALALTSRQRPLLVVLEVCLPDRSGYEICRALRNEFGEELPIMFVSARRTEPGDRVAGLMLGADDYLTKPLVPGEVLLRARGLIRRAARASGLVPDLTSREQEVLRLLAEGLDDKEIGARLFISPSTVGSHVEHIFTKLGVRNRAQAVAVAYREQLLAKSADSVA